MVVQNDSADCFKMKFFMNASQFHEMFLYLVLYLVLYFTSFHILNLFNERQWATITPCLHAEQQLLS